MRALRALSVVAVLAGVLSGGAGSAAASKRHCMISTKPVTVAYERVPGVAANLTSLDIWAPMPKCRVGDRRAPVVMFVHGGSYQRGDKSNTVADKVRMFNSRGWIFVSVNYRLTTPGVASSAHYPDHYRDVAAAVAWVRSHISSTSTGNPHRIALLGHSSGADIVSNVVDNPHWLTEQGLSLSAIKCAAPLDTEGFDKARAEDAAEAASWQEALGNDPNYLTDTSATLLSHAGTHIPNTFTVYRGTPRRQSIEMGYAAALRAAGVTTTLINVSSLSHEEVNQRIGAPGDTVITPQLVRFLATCFHGPAS